MSDKHSVVDADNGRFLSLDRKGVLTPATAWVGLEDIVLSDITPTEKDKHCVHL